MTARTLGNATPSQNEDDFLGELIFTKVTTVSTNEIKLILKSKTNSKAACNVGIVDDAGVVHLADSQQMLWPLHVSTQQE